AELLALTDSTLAKLRAMPDAEFDELELYPDFDE
ncbi:transposon-transfer assisting family protein, partial [Dysosmobacter sp.]